MRGPKPSHPIELFTEDETLFVEDIEVTVHLPAGEVDLGGVQGVFGPDPRDEVEDRERFPGDVGEDLGSPLIVLGADLVDPARDALERAAVAGEDEFRRVVADPLEGVEIVGQSRFATPVGGVVETRIGGDLAEKMVARVEEASLGLPEGAEKVWPGARNRAVP